MFVNVFITLALVGTISAASNVQPMSMEHEDCPQICPLFYAPICGTDGEYYEEFDNLCELKANNCRLQREAVKAFVATALDWCRTEMVIGMDSLLEKMDNLDMTKPECQKSCMFTYTPVCISNGIYRAVVPDRCDMDAINCALDNQDTFKVLQNYTC